MTKKNSIIPYLLFGIPILVGVYFIMKSLRGNNKKNDDVVSGDVKEENPNPPKKNNNATTSTDSDFPLKKGSKGTLVKQLQQALGGKSVLKKYGVDGAFGSETETALVKVFGKKIVNSQDELEQIASKRNLTIRNGQVLPKYVAAPTTPVLAIKNENSLKDAITGEEINPFLKY